jgi:AraC-like DNA-binding protein
MTPLASAEGHWVLASHGDQLAQVVRRWDVTPDRLVAGLGLTEAALQDPTGHLSAATYVALIERARVLTGEPGLGFYLGLQKCATAYGFLGFAAMAAASLREALEIMTRYTPAVTSLVHLRLEVERSVACLVIDEQVDLGSARDVPLISLIFGMRRLAIMGTGQDLQSHYVDLSMPEPAYFPRFKHLMPSARFDQPATKIVFDAALLDLALVQANRGAMQLALEQCEHALDALGPQRDTDIERVRQILRSDGGYRSLEKVARALAVSPRTLRRRLASQGLSFSALVAEERQRKAKSLLDRRQIPLEEIAERTGYSTLSNFVRAFREWTGTTPAEYRRSRSAHAVVPSRA